MTRCIGCGAEVAGQNCASCQTPSRGARFAEQVELHRGSTLPNICCCCLGPSTTSLELRRGNFGTIAIAKVPSCRSCKLLGISTRVMKLVIWMVLAIGLAVIGSKLVPAYPEYAGLVGLLGAIPLALGLARVLAPARIGHTPQCQPAKLGRDAGGTRIYEFRNRAFAEMVRAANPSASPLERVTHAIHEMREGLGFPPSR
jgi:hypothetical protein